MRAWRAAAALAMALTFASLGPAVRAQNIARPNINIQGRGPYIAPTMPPRINPNVTGAATSVGRITPNIKTYQGCSYAYRNSDGECSNQAGSSADAGTGGTGGASGKAKKSGPPRKFVQAVLNAPTIANQLVAEIDGALTDAQADALARRHGLARIGSQKFPLLGATIGLFRITDGRSVGTARRELAADVSVHSVQPNFRYLLQGQSTVPAEGDPAQYALAQLRLPQAHTLARGANVTVAVIDSGIDVRHPELANSIADSFDALGSREGPHVHGTGVAGAIVSHARLMGSAPAARILAIRAFGVASGAAESNSYVILKALDYALAHGAQIVNMSFAGPKDELIERGIAALAAKGIVMVAAAGNAGAKSPPLYPAANANVIAVSATDVQDKFFAASNRGSYVAVAAPGVDIFLPAPDQKYQMTSGTSFSAAYVSGVAALMLERNPALKRDELRATLMKTARDLGSPGRDDLFGAGEADAYAAVQAVVSSSATPVATVSPSEKRENVSEQKDIPATRDLSAPGATMASDKAAVIDGNRRSAQ
jgi:subtilisin family serine protease